MKKYLQLGQSLFELLIAIVVVGITLVALVQIASSAISNNTSSKDRTLAARASQEAHEWLRANRDEDWATFRNLGTNSPTYCLQTLPTTVAGLSQGECGGEQYIPNTILIREVQIIYLPANPNEVTVNIVTSWTDGDGVHESRVSTVLTNWRTY